MDETPGSVTRRIRGLETGDVAAVQPLWNRYFVQLARLVRLSSHHRNSDSGVG